MLFPVNNSSMEINNNSKSKIFYTHPKPLQFMNKNFEITEKEIEELFWGLLKLIKSSAIREAENKYLATINSLKIKLKSYSKNN